MALLDGRGFGILASRGTKSSASTLYQKTAWDSNGGTRWSAARRFVTEKLLAFFAQEAARDGDAVIAFAENEAAGNQARSPLVVLVAALAAVRGDVLLRHAVNHRANSGPHACASTHRARLVRRIQDEIGQIAAIATAHVFERFELHVFDTGAGGFHAVAGATDDHLAFAHQARDDRADGIVSAVAG
jgi:hypothetical protein